MDPFGFWGLQIGYNFAGFLGFGGAGLSGGVAIAGDGSDLGSISWNTFQSSQFNAGVDLSACRGFQIALTPGAQCLSDLAGLVAVWILHTADFLSQVEMLEIPILFLDLRSGSPRR